jgi:RNA-directed DNA polymerase
VAPSFTGPLHQPGADIPVGTDEMLIVRHLLSHGASWRTFTFLGYTFRPRLARSKRGGAFVSFLPAIGDDERKRIGRVIRSWRLHRWSDSALTDLATAINAEVQGWINYYGRFYRSELVRLLRRINE